MIYGTNRKNLNAFNVPDKCYLSYKRQENDQFTDVKVHGVRRTYNGTNPF